MKWMLALGVLLGLCYFLTMPLLSSMARHDYQNIYQGMQRAKEASGGHVKKKRKRVLSFSEKYALGID